MALILQLETSTTSCSVALSENGETIALKELNERNVHASHITLFIQDVIRQAAISLNELDAVAVSMGPGSYTGLRIGVSTAKGLCYALDIPLIAINTLKAMTAGVRMKYLNEDVLFCPMIDARRMEVYTAVFDSSLNEISPVEAKVIDGFSFKELLSDSKMLFFGDGAAKCQEVLQSDANAFFDLNFFNSAGHLSSESYLKFGAGEFVDAAYFEPYYLKDFLVAKPKQK